ncbi:MAG: cupin domain-containing protein [Planctomycetes bacterium]|nr:cupin domain-containing protein [Planctomycetota bacterium]
MSREPFADVPWRQTRYPGVAVHFYASDRRTGRVVALIRMEPGCGYPAHKHRAAEDVVVLQGGYRDERGEHRAGTFLHYEDGSIHGPVGAPSPDGLPCVLLAVAHEGVQLLGG